jgi:hypothetical protein
MNGIVSDTLGIDSFSRLKEVGSEGAFVRLRTMDSGACQNLLYDLDGAISNTKTNWSVILTALPAKKWLYF